MIKKQVKTVIPTKWGTFKMAAFSTADDDPMPHIAMIHEDFDPSKPAYIRIHSECMTGDLFSSKRCDCGEQLDLAMQVAAQEGGLVLYLRQEGRGMGLIPKLKAYNIQDTGVNTIDANTHLGFAVDSREYGEAIAIMKDLGITKVHLMTNNPLKIKAMEESDIEVISRIPVIIPAQKENEGYLNTKRELMGHMY
ncbi:MAG: GTP cyclohydrolase II [Saprospiraceae bacterium]